MKPFINFLTEPLDPTPLKKIKLKRRNGDEIEFTLHGILDVHQLQIVELSTLAEMQYGLIENRSGENLGPAFLEVRVGDRKKRFVPTRTQIRMMAAVMVALDEDEHEWNIHRMFSMYVAEPEMFGQLSLAIQEMDNETKDLKKKASEQRPSPRSRASSRTTLPSSTGQTKPTEESSPS